MKELLEKIKNDWDDRISLHPFFWMGDEFQTENGFWETGKRDLDLIVENLPTNNFQSWSVLEYGSGVGRILKAAAKVFNDVVGVDSSQVAIELSSSYLNEFGNARNLHIDGANLAIFQDETFDFCFSFACLNHVSANILPKIVSEIFRVIKFNSFAVVQLYVGDSPLNIREEDTGVIRAYPLLNINKFFTGFGFEICNACKLKLPFDAKDYERNVEPYLFTLRKLKPVDFDLDALKLILNPEPEKEGSGDHVENTFEYRLAATLLHKQVDQGNYTDAIKTLEFVIKKYPHKKEELMILVEHLKSIDPVDLL